MKSLFILVLFIINITILSGQNSMEDLPKVYLFEGKEITEKEANRIYDIYESRVLNEFMRKKDTLYIRMSIDEKKINYFNKETNNNLTKRLEELKGKQFLKLKESLLIKDVDTIKLNQPLVLNLWFIACRPCIKEMPELNKLVKKYKNSGISFFAPTFEKEDDVNDFLKEKEFDYQILSDAKDIIDIFNFYVYPIHLLFDKNYILKDYIVGGKEGINDILDEKIQSIFLNKNMMSSFSFENKN